MTTPLDERIDEIERRIADAQDWIADGRGRSGKTVSDTALLTVVAQINEALKASAQRLQALKDARVREEP